MKTTVKIISFDSAESSDMHYKLALSCQVSSRESQSLAEIPALPVSTLLGVGVVPCASLPSAYQPGESLLQPPPER